MIDRRRARLGNAWREGLIALARRYGRTLTKNQARALIRSTDFPGAQLQSFLRELPQSLMARFVQTAGATVKNLDTPPTTATSQDPPVT